MPTIEINGKKVEAEAGSMIIEVADDIRVQIPRFCYHKKLSIAANCRMCLVEVEKAPKPLPACATPVTEGMKVWTHSPKALQAQKSVMEFLLINHPLDCPICDQGGECELQDLSMGYGQDDSRYTEGKRVVKDKDIGPLIATDLTRCIQCTRCVRFGTEIAGLRELGATGRGETMEIGTFIETSVTSELSGNVIDICPVGALTSKPYRFAARGWELKQMPSIAPHDSLGSNIAFHIRRNQILRVVPRENENINEVWLSDRDRFSYEGLTHSDRLQKPKMKRGKDWIEVSWEEALQAVVKEISSILKAQGPDQIGALISPNATLEEQYLFQKWLRALKINNIDHRLRQTDFRTENTEHLFPPFHVPISEIEQQSAALIVGSYVHKEVPIVGLKLRKMVLAGGKALVINPMDVEFNFPVEAKSIPLNGDLVRGLAGVAKAILDASQKSGSNQIPKGAEGLLGKIQPTANDIEMARQFWQGEKKIIVLGALATSHPAYSHLLALVNIITKLTDAKLVLLTDGVNSTGAWIAGCFPHQTVGGRSITEDADSGLSPGLNAAQMWEQELKAYILFHLEPDVDCVNGMKTLHALNHAKYVVAFTAYDSPALREAATILLPITPFSETSGTFVNAEGQWQSFNAIVPPFEESRPGWKILRVLGNLFECPGFDYETSEQVRTQIADQFISAKKEITENGWECAYPGHLEYLDYKGIRRIAPVPLYATDGLVRRAKALQQQTHDAGRAVVYLNHLLIHRLNLTSTTVVRVISEGLSLTLPFVEDNTIPDNMVMIPGATQETVPLGGPYTVVELQGL